MLVNLGLGAKGNGVYNQQVHISSRPQYYTVTTMQSQYSTHLGCLPIIDMHHHHHHYHMLFHSTLNYSSLMANSLCWFLISSFLTTPWWSLQVSIPLFVLSIYQWVKKDMQYRIWHKQHRRCENGKRFSLLNRSSLMSRPPATQGEKMVPSASVPMHVIVCQLLKRLGLGVTLDQVWTPTCTCATIWKGCEWGCGKKVFCRCIPSTVGQKTVPMFGYFGKSGL